MLMWKSRCVLDFGGGVVNHYVIEARMCHVHRFTTSVSIVLLICYFVVCIFSCSNEQQHNIYLLLRLKCDIAISIIFCKTLGRDMLCVCMDCPDMACCCVINRRLTSNNSLSSAEFS